MLPDFGNTRSLTMKPDFPLTNGGGTLVMYST